MDRAFSSGSSASPPTPPGSPSIGYPSSGNPGTATPATKPGAWWYHMITEELLAIQAAAGLTPSQISINQVATAIQSGKLFSSTAAGTADAITATFAPAVTALKDGMALYVRAGAANATTTPTFTPASGVIAPKNIVKGANAAVVAGDIAGAGHWIELQYDQTLDKWVLLNPATGITVATSVATVQGAFKNLVASATGTSANITVTVDEIVVESSSNAYHTLRSVSLSISGAASGVANGLDAGTLAVNSWYSLWLIWNGTTTAGLLSLSSTAPTMPSGYTHKARVGWIRTDSTVNKYPLGFRQYGREVRYVVAAGSNVVVLPNLVTSAVVQATYQSVSVSGAVPTTASKIHLSVAAAQNSYGALAPNANFSTALTSAATAAPIVWNGAGNSSAAYSFASGTLLLESNAVHWFQNNPSSMTGSTYINTYGWEDNI